MKHLSNTKLQQLSAMLTQARQMARANALYEAERLCREIIKDAPEYWDAQQQLAMLLAMTGRAAEAARHFRLIVKAHPAHAASHANLANALAESGNLDEAVTEFKRAITLNPSLTGARIAMGETLRRATRFDEAIALYKSVLDQDKTNHAAFNGLGLVYRDMKDFPRALECFEFASGNAPENADYRIHFAAALRDCELDNLAVEQLYKAASLRPNWLEAVVLLGDTLQRQRRYDEALECFERARQIKPFEPELVERTGYVYLDMGNTKHALDQFESVLDKHPDRFMAQLGVGRAHMDAGQSAQAAETFESLINANPDHPSAYFFLAATRKFKQGDPVIGQLQRLAMQTDGDKGGAIALNFALGKIYDDCKDWDAAWRHYVQGNQLRNEQYDYQSLHEEQKIDRLIATYSEAFMDAHREFGVSDESPVFIVGMPRSGTTLTEQIISSHPEVIGAGEVVYWVKTPEIMPYTMKTHEVYPNCLQNLEAEQAHQMADDYVALLRKIAGPGVQPKRITDKMPHNFMYLGLMALLFPKARIVHCRRDAMDNCLSIFFQNFGGHHRYAYDLANLGHHYRQYQRLMAHWHALLPGRILDINYEDTIADPEFWSRTLIEHVGLDWDDACLAPHKLERTVKTASHWQVRQPIYKTSVQRWRNYEQYLDPLKQSLALQG